MTTAQIEFNQIDRLDSQAEKLETIRNNVSRIIAQIIDVVVIMRPGSPDTATLFDAAAKLQKIHDSF